METITLNYSGNLVDALEGDKETALDYATTMQKLVINEYPEIEVNLSYDWTISGATPRHSINVDHGEDNIFDHIRSMENYLLETTFPN